MKRETLILVAAIIVLIIIVITLVIFSNNSNSTAQRQINCGDQRDACVRGCGANANCNTECQAQYRNCANGGVS